MEKVLSNKRTKGAIISSSLLNEPFSALLPLLPFILIKEMDASAFNITILAILKPLMSLLSFFYSRALSRLNLSLKANLLLTGVFARAPFLLALLSNEPWCYIIACAMYMLFSRSSIPPWMEILRLNLNQKILQKIFSFSSMLAYSLGIVLALILGFFLDTHSGFWKVAFCLFLLIGLVATFLQALLPKNDRAASKRTQLSIKPLSEMRTLLSERADFLRFQYVFMAGGFGLMLLSPVLPGYFCNVLNINYKELLVIFSVCKAVGFVLSSPFWRRALSIENINWFTKTVLAGFLFYASILFLAKLHISLLFLAYVVYGAFQAASHLVWHMSGPLFCHDEDSAIFSSINVFTVGLRGCFAPILGAVISMYYGFNGVLIASCLCFIFGIVFTQTIKIHQPGILKS